MAVRFAEEGAKIFAVDLNPDSLIETVERVKKAGGTIETHNCSVTDGAAVAEMVQACLAKFGRIDVLVNNVGGTIWIKPYHLYLEDEVKLEIERSLYSTLWCCLAALPIMMQQSSGSIVNVGSQSVRGLYRAPYAASKGGILALSKVLAMEYGRCGIRVNTMSPGGTDIADRVTPRQLIRPGVMADEPEATEAERYRGEMAQDIRNQQALQRRGLPEEQAAAIAFLASDDASFITGQVINCSGGQS